MTLTIELRPDLEASLAQIAAGHGVSVAEYVQRLVEQAVPSAGRPGLTPEQRAALWRESAKQLPHTPLLSDAAISRDTIYAERG